MYRLSQFIIFLVLTMLSLVLNSQDIDISLSMYPNPPENPFSWDGQSPSIFQIELFNNESDFIQVIVLAQIDHLDQGVTIGQISQVRAIMVNLPPNQATILNGPQGAVISNMDFFDPEVINNQALPSGNYEFCIEILNAQNQFPIGHPACEGFMIQGNTIPPNVSAALIINNPPTRNLNSWDALPNQFMVEINNNENQPEDVIVLASLIGITGNIAETNIAIAEVITVQPGNNILNGVQTFPVANMDILDFNVQTTGLLASGEYDICLDILWPPNESILDQVNCEPFTIEAAALNVNCDLFIDAVIPSNFNNWDLPPHQFSININNSNTDPVEIMVLASIEGDNGLVAQTNAMLTQSINLQPGHTNFTESQIFPSSSWDIFDANLLTSGIFQDGTYQICITTVEAGDERNLLCESCQTFDIETTDPELLTDVVECPVLISPTEGAILESADLTNSIFQWFPSQDLNNNNYSFNFKLFEIIEGQSLGEAYQNNIPVIEEILNQFDNIFEWPEDIFSPDCDQKYGWTVTIINHNTDIEICKAFEIFDFTILCDSIFEWIDLDSITKDSIIIQTDSLPNSSTIESGTTTLVIKDSTSTPPTPENPTDSIPNTYIKDCNTPSFVGSEVASPISLGMAIEKNELMKYPRAVAIRAEGIDWDIATWMCDGCEGLPSKDRKAVRDNVHNYKWKLTGLGQLNEPVDQSFIDSLQNELAKLLKGLAVVSDSIDLIQKDTAAIPKIISELEAKLTRAEKAVSHQQNKCDSISTLKNKRSSKLNQRINDLPKYNRIEKESYQTAKRIYKEISALEKFLSGAQSDEEKNKMKTITNLRKSLKTIQDQLIQKEKEILSQSAQLSESIAVAEKTLNDLSSTYNLQEKNIVNFTKQVNALEASVFTDPIISTYILRKRQWDQKAYTFINRYAKTSHQPALLNSQNELSKELINYSIQSNVARANQLEVLLNSYSNFYMSLEALCNNQQNCTKDLLEVESSKTILIEKINALLSSTSIYDATTHSQISNLRGKIRRAEKSLKQTSESLKQAEKAYQNAIANFKNTVKRLKSSQQKIIDQKNEKSEALLEQEGLYNNLKDSREKDLEENYVPYANEIKGKKTEYDNKLYEHEKARDSVSLFVRDTAVLKVNLIDIGKAIKKCNRQLAAFEKAKIKIENEIKALEKKKTELAKKENTLTDKKKAIEKAINELQQKINKLLSPTAGKTANGPVVYYIPPPLEEIIKDKKTFEKLKLDISTAELEVNKHSISKKEIQGKLVNEIESVAKELINLKNNQAKLPGLLAEQNSLDGDYNIRKTQLHHTNSKNLGKIENQIINIEQKMDSLKSVIKDLQNDSTDLHKAILSIRTEMSHKWTQFKDLEKHWQAVVNAHEKELSLMTNIAATISDKHLELEDARIELTSALQALNRAKDDQLRADALQDIALISTATTKINTIQINIKQLSDITIPSIENKITTGKESLTAARTRVHNSRAKVIPAKKAMDKAEAQLDHSLVDSIEVLNRKFRKVNADLRYTRSELEKANDLKRNKAQKQKDAKSNNNETVNNNNEVKDLKERLDNINNQIEAIHLAISKSTNEIEAAQSHYKNWMKEADAKILVAKDSLVKAEDNLYEFLLKAFEQVDFEVKLELVAEDRNIDEWRAKDGTKTLIKQLKYPRSRIPSFVDGNTIAVENKPVGIPSNKDAKCIVNIGAPIPAGGFQNELLENKLEPRTIALLYKEGQPLWKEWPVIPKEKGGKLLAMDIVKLNTVFSIDSDDVPVNCTPADGETICGPSESGKSIKEHHLYKWKAEKIINQHQYIPSAFWQTQVVPIPDIEAKQNYISNGYANQLGGDPVVSKKNIPTVNPGVLIETNDSIIGRPDTAIEIQARVVMGDHQPLKAGETIDFIAKKVRGKSEKFGFGNGVLKKTEKTNNDGYAKVDFEFGDGFADYEITVQWHRNNAIIATEKIKAKAPLNFNFYKLNNGPEDLLWTTAERVIKGDDIESAINSIQTLSGAKQMHAVTGLQDFEYNFVNKEKVHFQSNQKILELKDKEEESYFIGIARTLINNVPEDKKDKGFKFEISAKLNDAYKGIAQAKYELTKSYNTLGIKEFYVGKGQYLFKIEMPETMPTAEAFSTTGKVVFSAAEIKGLLGPTAGTLVTKVTDEIKVLELEVRDIKVAKGQAYKKDAYIAKAGKVVWKGGEKPVKFNLFGVEVQMDSIALSHTYGGEIGGKITDSTYFSKGVGYHAILDPSGDFLGTITALPEIKIPGDFKLKEGAAITIDYHRGESKGDRAKNFQGVYIHTAALELPEKYFAKSTDDGKSATLSVNNFYIGNQISKGQSGKGFALGGNVNYKGKLVELGAYGYEFAARNIDLDFKDNALVSGRITGDIVLGKPFVGQLSTTMGKKKNANEWIAEISTTEPVVLPRMGITFSIFGKSGANYKVDTKEGLLLLNTYIESDKIGQVKVHKLEYSTKGYAKVEKVDWPAQMDVLGGFTLKSKSFAFDFNPQESWFKINGGFEVKKLVTAAIDGSIEIKSGPKINVEIENATIKCCDNSPVDLYGKIAYKENEFKGDFSFKLKNILDKGIETKLVIGYMKESETTGYDYWFGSLHTGAEIPIATTGLAFTSFGGGLGYNYNPPFGAEQGSPAKAADGQIPLSVMASVGIGNALPPNSGNFFDSEFTMALTSSYFGLGGKVWMLNQEDALFGNGNLKMDWSKSQINGAVGMFIGLPDAQGDILKFDSKIKFAFPAQQNKLIWSERINGTLFKDVKAKGSIVLTTTHMNLNGKLYYTLSKKAAILGYEAGEISAKLKASGHLNYDHVNKILDANANFKGAFKINVEIPIHGTYRAASGTANAFTKLYATKNSVALHAKLKYYYNILGVEGGPEYIEIGYKYE